MRVEVDDNLGRALTSLAAAEAGTQEAMRAEAAAEIGRVWSPALISASGNALERKILATGARADVTPQGFTLTAGVGPAASGGLGQEDDDWVPVEFGMNPQRIQAPNRRKSIRIAGSGRPMRVASMVWVGKNLRPRNRDGYVVLPTARKRVPEFVAAWVRGLIKQFAPVDGTALEIRKD